MRDRERRRDDDIRPAAIAVQDELRTAARERTLPQYANKDPQTLTRELESIGRDRFRPIPADAFETLRRYCLQGDPLKWVVTTNGEILFGPTHHTHAALAGGEPVLAAGHAYLVEIDRQRKQFFIPSINNTSGHYQPAEPSIDIAIRLLRAHGFTVPDAAKQPHSTLFS